MVPAVATIERYVASTVPVLADRVRRVLEETRAYRPADGKFLRACRGSVRRAGARQIVAGQRPVGGKTDSRADRRRVSAGAVRSKHSTMRPHVLMNAFWPGPLTDRLSRSG
mgnify:CR=1 FL=1